MTAFDWLRRCYTGAELLAILRLLRDDPTCFERLQVVAGQDTLGAPSTAVAPLCLRCWLHPPPPNGLHCPACRLIREGAYQLSGFSRTALVIWGYVNQLPTQLRDGSGFRDAEVLGSYLRDERRFLILIRRRDLQPWLQELTLYHGPNLRGHLQIFPTTGGNEDGTGMGDLLCQAIRHESQFPLDKLRVRFYYRPFHVVRPQSLEAAGLLTYEISEFLGLLEMAMIFRSVLKPADQELLLQLLTTRDEAAESFYWGRFTGLLNQQGRDLLDAWAVRQWPLRRTKMFYELTDYVDYRSAA